MADVEIAGGRRRKPGQTLHLRRAYNSRWIGRSDHSRPGTDPGAEPARILELDIRCWRSASPRSSSSCSAPTRMARRCCWRSARSPSGVRGDTARRAGLDPRHARHLRRLARSGSSSHAYLEFRLIVDGSRARQPRRPADAPAELRVPAAHHAHGVARNRRRAARPSDPVLAPARLADVRAVSLITGVLYRGGDPERSAAAEAARRPGSAPPSACCSVICSVYCIALLIQAQALDRTPRSDSRACAAR